MNRTRITRLHALTTHWIQMATACRDMQASSELYAYFQFTQGSMDMMDPFSNDRTSPGPPEGMADPVVTKGLTLFARQCLAVGAMNRAEAFLRRWETMTRDIPNGLGAPSLATVKTIREMTGTNRLEILESLMSLLAYDMLRPEDRSLEAETLSEIREAFSGWLGDRRGFIYGKETSPDHHQRVAVRFLEACLRLDMIISRTHPDQVQDWAAEVSRQGSSEEREKLFVSDLSLACLPRPDRPLIHLVSREDSPPVTTQGFLYIQLHDAVSLRPRRPV